jgi:hypothetical protein
MSNSYLERRVKLQDALLAHTFQHLTEKGYPILEGGGPLLDLEAKAINQSTPLDDMSLAYSFRFGNIGRPEHRLTLVFTKAQDGNPQVSIHTRSDSPPQVMVVSSDDLTESVAALKRLVDETLDEIALAERD